MLNDNVFQAFSAASSVSANYLSLSIRTCLLSSFLMWAAWCALELMKHYKNHSTENIAGLLGKYVQLFFIISVAVALTFIS